MQTANKSWTFYSVINEATCQVTSVDMVTCVQPLNYKHNEYARILVSRGVHWTVMIFVLCLHKQNTT